MRKIFCALVTLVFCYQISAQTLPQAFPEEGEDAYIPDTLIEVRNAIKIDPFLVVKGELVLNYERAISNHFSAELVAGITRRDWTQPGKNNNNDDLRRNITVKTGPTFKLGVRYYSKNSPELHGFYVMPQFAYRIYEKEFAELDSTGTLNGNKYTDKRNVKELSVTFGYQHLMLTNNFLLDFYATLGYVEQNVNAVIRVPDTIETLFYTENYIEHYFNPMIGIRMGFGF
jgi:hypothetical protein